MGPSNFASLIERQAADHWGLCPAEIWRKEGSLLDWLPRPFGGIWPRLGSIPESDSLGIFWLSPWRNGLNCQPLKSRAGRQAGGEVRRGSQSKTVG
jgi:hypothetical protein